MGALLFPGSHNRAPGYPAKGKQEWVAFHFGFRNGTKELESGIQLCGRYKCEARLLAVG